MARLDLKKQYPPICHLQEKLKQAGRMGKDVTCKQ